MLELGDSHVYRLLEYLLGESYLDLGTPNLWLMCRGFGGAYTWDMEKKVGMVTTLKPDILLIEGMIFIEDAAKNDKKTNRHPLWLLKKM